MVLASDPDNPQLSALAEAGITWDVLSGAGAGASASASVETGPGTEAGPGAQAEVGPGAQAEADALARLLDGAATACSGSVVWLAPTRGTDGISVPVEVRVQALLDALSRLPGGGPDVQVLHGSRDLPGARLLDLVATMDTLRIACPWDAKQTHESLAPHLLEEPYEALEALETGDDRGFREELGDVLLQVVFHARIAAERGDAAGYTIDDVADGIVAKLVRRHPHVFGAVTVSGADEVKQNWDAIKKAERAERASPGDTPPSALDGVPFGQPALALAAQLQRRAERAGVPPELADLEASGDAGAELGGELFRLAASARGGGLDPELELRAAARRYLDRVRRWEQASDQTGS
jgi:XTP/dITP diphosphohydrolase